MWTQKVDGITQMIDALAQSVPELFAICPGVALEHKSVSHLLCLFHSLADAYQIKHRPLKLLPDPPRSKLSDHIHHHDSFPLVDLFSSELLSSLSA